MDDGQLSLSQGEGHSFPLRLIQGSIEEFQRLWGNSRRVTGTSAPTGKRLRSTNPEIRGALSAAGPNPFDNEQNLGKKTLRGLEDPRR